MMGSDEVFVLKAGFNKIPSTTTHDLFNPEGDAEDGILLGETNNGNVQVGGLMRVVVVVVAEEELLEDK